MVPCFKNLITVAILPMRKLKFYRNHIYIISGPPSFETQAYNILKFSTLFSVVICQVVLQNFHRERLE